MEKLSDVLQSSNALESLYGILPGFVYVYDLSARRNVYTNRSLAALLGHTPQDLFNLGDQLLATVLHPDDLARALAHHAHMQRIKPGTTAEIAFRVRDGTGGWRWLHAWEVVLDREGPGAPRWILGFAQDVTERVQIEHELRESRRRHAESEQRWRSIAENPFDFVVVIDRDYKYTYVNFTAPGLHVEDLIGKKGPKDFVSPPYQAAMLKAFEYAFREGRPTSYEVYVEPLQKWYHNLVGPIREGNEVTHLSVLTRDITGEKHAQTKAIEAEQQLRRVEAKLAQSAKLEAVGQLAGGIAHDFNNLLTGIGGIVEVLAAQLEGHPSLPDVVELRQAVQRGAALTRQLLAFSRQQAVAPVVLSLNTLLGTASGMLRRLIGPEIEIALTLPEQDLRVRADPNQLEQVLMNLAVNARDAMPAGGQLTLALSRVAIDASARNEHIEATAGPYARLSVSDTGSGMDETTLARIFEPFFTTKPFGMGTGLGLAMVHGIVKKAGGFLEVKSRPSEGSTFDVWLPLSQGEPSALQPERDADRGRQEIVLLVEDDDMVLRFTKQLLQRLGYHVLTAARAQDALDMVESGVRFDVLLTDVLLPDIDGHALFRRIAAARGTLPVVFMSGYTDNLLADAGLKQAGAVFLGKPFTQDALATAVRAALDTPTMSRGTSRHDHPASPREK